MTNLLYGPKRVGVNSQISMPADMQSALGIAPGSEVSFEIIDGVALIRPATDRSPYPRRRLTLNSQLTLPRALLEALGIRIGDSVYTRLVDDGVEFVAPDRVSVSAVAASSQSAESSDRSPE